MLKAYKYRLYPNKQQEELIQKTFGCVRFVYNHTLAYRKELYEAEKKSLNKIACNSYMTNVLKKEYEWLTDVDKFALNNAVFNMDIAYQKFFKEHAGYPKFKSKRDHRKSYTTNYTNSNIEVSFENNKIKLPKLKWVNVVFHREFDGKIKSATISQVPSGKYYCSILVETKHKVLEKTDGEVGIDLGIKDLLVTSDGEKYDNPKLTKKYEKKLAKEQRKLAKKQKGSKNWDRQRIKVAKVHEKIRNIRTNNLHQISHGLISENQVIVSEDLSVKNMVQNKNLAKSISDCGWYELTRQLSYKAEWNERNYIKIGRFIPSSQICSNCGYVNKEVKDLFIREWDCPQCGMHHDRDINAAINILNEGLKMLQAS